MRQAGAGGKALAILLVILVAVLTGGPPTARADLDGLGDIRDRDFALDIYSGSALGSARVVGMGGAAVASEEGSAGSILNPAAAAARAASSTDRWDWDWHLDWLNPTLGSDNDNNGIPEQEDYRGFVLTGGVILQYEAAAVGAVANTQRRTIEVGGQPLEAEVTASKLILARSLDDEQIVLGLAARIATFELIAPTAGRSVSLFQITGGNLELGGLWRPARRSWRVGASAALPITGEEVVLDECEGMETCAGLIVPSRVQVPWRIAAGVAWRSGGPGWNRHIEGDWRDERALIIAADLVVTGAVSDGHGLEAFALQKLQPSGRDVAISPRAGVEYEWLPGWLRVRGGSYWEPARFADVPGRLHVTAGVEGRMFSFCFWDDRYRARASLTLDLADGYVNSALGVGFWH